MYCQVTQLEKQGGPEAQREMVRDREQAVHERSCVRLKGPKWIFRLLKKSVCLHEGVDNTYDECQCVLINMMEICGKERTVKTVYCNKTETKVSDKHIIC